MKIVIVDDEVNANAALHDIVSEHIKQAEIISFNNSLQALVFLIKNQVDIVFLDINMPIVNGLYIAEQILLIFPETKICFVSAYDNYAIQAFELNAIDYILKPYSENRVIKSLQKLTKQNLSLNVIENFNNVSKYSLDIICATKNEELILLTYDTIIYIESIGRKTKIITDNDEIISSKTLKFYEQKLGNHSFFRCHKGYLVNLNKVSKIIPLISYNYNIHFKNISSVVPLSRGKVKELKKILKL